MATEQQIEAVRRQANAEAEAAIQGEEEEVLARKTAKDDKTAEKPSVDDQDATRNYRYPLELSDDFPVAIKFQAFKVEGVDIFEATGIKKVAEEVVEIFKDSEKESVADENTDTETKREIISDSKNKPKELVTVEKKKRGTPWGRVTLPMMAPLRYNDLANYTSTGLGLAGGAAEAALFGQNPFAGASENGQLKSVASNLVAQAAAKAVGVGIGAAVGSLVPGGGIGGAALGGLAAAGAGLGEGLGAAARSASRILAAPNLRTLFTGIDIRDPFTFDFKMIATSPEENQEIKNIVKFFRQELYPEMIPLGTTGVPLAYKYPNVFEIEIVNRFGENPGFRILRSYLRNVQTTFNEQSAGMFSDGQFVEVTMSLTFVEITALDKQKVREGY